MERNIENLWLLGN